MGFNQDLTKATELAVRDMIEFLVTEKHLSRDDCTPRQASRLTSTSHQLVDGNKEFTRCVPKQSSPASNEPPSFR